MTDHATDTSARGARILLFLFGGLFITLSIALTVFPADLSGSILIILGAVGVLLITLGVFLPKRARAWLGEFIALWP